MVAAAGFTVAVVVAVAVIAVPVLAAGFAALAWVEGEVAAVDAAAGFSVVVMVVDVPVLVAVSVAFAAGFAAVAWVEGEIVALFAVIVVFAAVGAVTAGFVVTSLAATSVISREDADTVAEVAAVFAEVEPPSTVFLEAVDLATFFVI